MFLQELRRLAGDPDIARELAVEGYAYRRVRQMISLDRKGRLLGCVDLAEDVRGPGSRGKVMQVPDLVRTSGTAPMLLADGPDYVFGIDPNPAKEARAATRHKAFVDLARDCADATEALEVGAVVHYLESGDVPSDLHVVGERVTFEVDGVPVVELPAVREYWARRLRPSSGRPIECLVCGARRPAADPWPVPVKRIPGGQTSGNQLVSANEHAFESYGLSGSQTSPACRECAAGVGNALNWLLQHPAHSLRTARSVFTFWSRGDAGFDFASMMSAPQPDQVLELLRAPRTALQGALDLDADRFYLAELAASGARIVLRSWIETATTIARDNLAAYFAGHMVVMPDGSMPRPVSAVGMAMATARDTRELHPEAVRHLISTALTGSPLPPVLLHLAVGRCRVGDTRGRSQVMVTHARAALLKLALSRPGQSPDEKEAFMRQLDAAEPDPAYQCGRLLAEMEAVQRAALGNPSATLTDRFYGAASSAPATVFGSLLRNMHNHLAKLRKERPGVYWGLDRRVTDIVSRLDRLPTSLSLREQAVFALGYYHQRARDRSDAHAAHEALLASALKGEDDPETEHAEVVQ